jgi:hypothetical protein
VVRTVAVDDHPAVVRLELTVNLRVALSRADLRFPWEEKDAEDEADLATKFARLVVVDG